MKRERFDAIVIGAGMAGATAAALLAQRGHRVLVLERDQHPGGCAANFEEDGYAFAVGATVGMGLQPGGIVANLFARLGMAPTFTPVDPAIAVMVGDRIVNLHQDRKRWNQERERAFPGQTRNKRAFWRHIERLAAGLKHAAARHPVMPFAHPLDVLDTARAAHPKLLPVLLNLHRSVGDLLAQYQIDDAHHRAFIDGQLLDAMQTTADDCAAPNGALALDIYRDGAQVVHGGLQQLTRELLAFVARAGGSVRFNTRVRHIDIENGRVQGVRTREGHMHAPVVVSTLPIANTDELVGDATPTRLRARAQQHRGRLGAFTLYLGVDERALPRDVAPFLQISDPASSEAAHPLASARNLLISISPAYDTTRAPLGKRAITVSTHVDAQAWLTLANDEAAYQQSKAEVAERVLQRVERWLPRVRDGIEVMHAGTPRTFVRYTRRAGGLVGGFPQKVGFANFDAPSHRTDIAGLYLAGDTIFPGQGMLGVTLSGSNAARSAHRVLRSPIVPIRGQRTASIQEVVA